MYFKQYGKEFSINIDDLSLPLSEEEKNKIIFDIQ